jgi:hypothetical protein
MAWTIGIELKQCAIAGVVLAAAVAAGTLGRPAIADEHWRGHDRRDWHRGGGWGGYYGAPPVVYGSPYYYPPPVVYGPGIGLNLNIR